MKKTGFVLGVLLVLLLGSVALGEGTVLTEAEILGEGTLLRPYTLLASYSLESIHAIPMREAPDAYLWDAEKDGFVAVQADEQVGLFQFVAVADLDGDKVGDAMLIVPREDSLAYWDADWSYADPRAAEDASYADAFAQAIPYGERMLGFAKEGMLGGAAADYHNLVAPGDLAASAYYPAYDFMNSTGTDTV